MLRDEKIRGSHWEERIEITLKKEGVATKSELLRSLGFVYVSGGEVQLGTPNPIPCRFEGHRANETRVRVLNVEPFWISRTKVTNKEFEEFNSNRIRPPTSLGNRHPITNITYLNALRYAEWFSEKYGLAFSLPTEPEWVFAAAPFGWEYPYHADKASDSSMAHNFVMSQTEVYGTIEVDDPTYPANFNGLYQMGGNAGEFMFGSYFTPEGAWGAETDGRYCIIKSGDFGHCPLGTGTQRRAILDVGVRSERVSMRLVHPDIKVATA